MVGEVVAEKGLETQIPVWRLKLQDLTEKFAGGVVQALVPAVDLLGTKLGNWYEKNSYHKFKSGDILVHRFPKSYGKFSQRTVLVVNGYAFDIDSKDGQYDIDSYQDVIPPNLDLDSIPHDEIRWLNPEYNSDRSLRKNEIHFKWNVENKFKKVPVSTVEEALKYYK